MKRRDNISKRFISAILVVIMSRINWPIGKYCIWHIITMVLYTSIVFFIVFLNLPIQDSSCFQCL